MKPIKVINNYVYIVLVYPAKTTQTHILGVYINKNEAEGCKAKAAKRYNNPETYIAILKKPVEGKQRWDLQVAIKNILAR